MLRFLQAHPVFTAVMVVLMLAASFIAIGPDYASFAASATPNSSTDNGLNAPFPCGVSSTASTHSGHGNEQFDVDFTGSKHDKLVASADGDVVSYSQVEIDGRGAFIVIDYGDVTAHYFHLVVDSIPQAVIDDDTVDAGDKIGKLGESGFSTGPHLHLEHWNSSGASESAGSSHIQVQFGNDMVDNGYGDTPEETITSANCGFDWESHIGDIISNGPESTWYIGTEGIHRMAWGDVPCYVEYGATIHDVSVVGIPVVEAASPDCVPDVPTMPGLTRNHRGHEHSYYQDGDVANGQYRYGLDFNGDGVADVFKANGSVWAYSPGGTGGWVTIRELSIPIEDLAFGDFDGDGKTDIMRATGTKWKFYYASDDWFLSVQMNRTAEFDKLAIGDFDGDGKTDVFKTISSGWWYSPEGTEGWKSIRDDVDIPLEDLAFGDFDGDGKTDIMRAIGTKWKVYEAIDDWYLSFIRNRSIEFSDLAFGDFDGDGGIDVFRSVDGVWEYSSAAYGGWTEMASSSAGVGVLLIGDFDGDLHADVFKPMKDNWNIAYYNGVSWRWELISDSRDAGLEILSA